MFSLDHEIWKFAYNADKLDDWLGYAEHLIERWSAQNAEDINFQNTFEIVIASYLLMDDLLPLSAKKAFSMLVLRAMTEIDDKKFAVERLHIQSPPRGRKENTRWRRYVISTVHAHIRKGLPKTEAYRIVAETEFRSPDTIRRIYERAIKRIKEK